MHAGTVKLVGTNYDKIVLEVSALLDDEDYYNQMSQAVNPSNIWRKPNRTRKNKS